MAGFGGYYKGDKKKPKKNKDKKQGVTLSDVPTFVMPDIIEKKKKDE